RQPGPRAPEQAGREGVEALDSPVAVRRGQVGETEPRGRKLDVRPGTCERFGELVAVPRRVCGGVGDDDAPLSPTEERRGSSAPGPSSTAPPTRRGARPTSARWSS